MLDVHSLMTELAATRPVFHSEADFQHALAWGIRETIPDSQIRLEFKPFLGGDRQIYLDIWIPTKGIALELKYCTRALITHHEGEIFALNNQSAQDLRRYDFLKDIQRLEEVLSRRENAKAGFAILLTNDQSYWNPPRDRDPIDADFRLHEGRTLAGKLAWSERASKGTTKGREEPISISGSHGVLWQDYATLERLVLQESSLVVKGNELFRYLVVEISQPT